MTTTTTRRPGRYARTSTRTSRPGVHYIEISAGPGCASYGLVDTEGVELFSTATAPGHFRHPVAF